MDIRWCLILLMWLPWSACDASSNRLLVFSRLTTDMLLQKLDSLLEKRELFEAEKLNRIGRLHRQDVAARTPEARYLLNRSFYEEYVVYDSDSALMYVDRNLKIARELNRKEWIDECLIKRSFVLSATGLLKEAMDELDGIDSRTLSVPMQIDYFGQKMYLFSHFKEYSGGVGTRGGDYYYGEEILYQDSVCQVITRDHPCYLWYMGWKYIYSPDVKKIKEKLETNLASSALDSRRDAMNAWVLAFICKEMGDEDSYVKYLICSAIADLKTVTRDIASFEDLAKILLEKGDIDRANEYITFSLNNALAYHNRIRLTTIIPAFDKVRNAYLQQTLRSRQNLRIFLTVVTLLLVVLLVAVVFIIIQMKRLARSRQALNTANIQLNRNVQELQDAHRDLALINSELQESNYVKEQYIGYVFSICSKYISKLDEFRIQINRKMKAKMFDDVKKITDNHSMVQGEVKDFYANFDAIFLNVYPNFVREFNALLRPEEQVVLKEGELLNTDLRIYALIRLGISDSVKISEFLHCSPQTVYNYRMKMRNKSILPKEEFDKRISTLGRMEKE